VKDDDLVPGWRGELGGQLECLLRLWRAVTGGRIVANFGGTSSWAKADAALASP
jgi:hypothetical protein